MKDTRKKVWIRVQPKTLRNLSKIAKTLNRSRASLMAQIVEDYYSAKTAAVGQ